MRASCSTVLLPISHLRTAAAAASVAADMRSAVGVAAAAATVHTAAAAAADENVRNACCAYWHYYIHSCYCSFGSIYVGQNDGRKKIPVAFLQRD